MKEGVHETNDLLNGSQLLLHLHEGSDLFKNILESSDSSFKLNGIKYALLYKNFNIKGSYTDGEPAIEYIVKAIA